MKLTRHDLDRAKPCTHTFTCAYSLDASDDWDPTGRGTWITWFDRTGTPTDEANGVSRRCLSCGEWQGLGPANDRRVPRVEMDLAESLALQSEDWHEYVVECWLIEDQHRAEAMRRRAGR